MYLDRYTLYHANDNVWTWRSRALQSGAQRTTFIALGVALGLMNKILFFIFAAVVSACSILTFSTAGQGRGQIQNYSYPPRLLDELKRLR
jgi:hypothetical protein